MEETSDPIEEPSTPTKKDNATVGGEEKGRKKKNNGISQYLIDRENIEKNRELLAPFFEGLEELKKGGPATKNKKKDGKKKTNAEKGKSKAMDIKDKRITR